MHSRYDGYSFPLRNTVTREKVRFHNRYGVELAGDLYLPREVDGKLAAVAVSGPFGAVKEQCSGLYAQTMAERGFLTMACMTAPQTESPIPTPTARISRGSRMSHTTSWTLPPAGAVPPGNRALSSSRMTSYTCPSGMDTVPKLTAARRESSSAARRPRQTKR